MLKILIELLKAQKVTVKTDTSMWYFEGTEDDSILGAIEKAFEGFEFEQLPDDNAFWYIVLKDTKEYIFAFNYNGDFEYIENNVRPVKCVFCNQRMFDKDDGRWTPEVQVELSRDSEFEYAHLTCYQSLKNVIPKIDLLKELTSTLLV